MLGLKEKHLDFTRKMILVRHRYYRGDLNTTQTRNFATCRWATWFEDLKHFVPGDPGALRVPDQEARAKSVKRVYTAMTVL